MVSQKRRDSWVDYLWWSMPLIGFSVIHKFRKEVPGYRWSALAPVVRPWYGWGQLSPADRCTPSTTPCFYSKLRFSPNSPVYYSMHVWRSRYHRGQKITIDQWFRPTNPPVRCQQKEPAEVANSLPLWTFLKFFFKFCDWDHPPPRHGQITATDGRTLLFHASYFHSPFHHLCFEFIQWSCHLWSFVFL